jgi:hypothetical protein
MYVIRTAEDPPRYMIRDRKGVQWTPELENASRFSSYATAAARVPREANCAVVTVSEAEAAFTPPYWSSTI